jgi:hypothetical protein
MCAVTSMPTIVEFNDLRGKRGNIIVRSSVRRLCLSGSMPFGSEPVRFATIDRGLTLDVSELAIK